MQTLEKVRAKIARNLPKQTHSSLTWSKISNCTLKSECGRFTIGKCMVKGVNSYEAWLGKTPLGFRLDSADAAKQLCESHARNLEKEPVDNTVPAALQKKSKAEQVAK